MQVFRKKKKRKREDLLAFPTNLPWFVGPGIALAVGLLIGIGGTLRVIQASSPTSVAESACLTADSPPTLGTADDVAGYGQVIQTYLSACGDPMQLKQTLLERGMLPNAALLITGVIDHYDVTRDGINDVIVNMYYPDPQLPSTYALWIYVCDDSSYRQVSEENFLGPGIASDPGLFVDDVRDLNNDMLPEVVYSWVSCGANTCYLDLTVLTWDSPTESMRSVLSIGFPVGSFRLWDTDDDGMVEVVIQRGVAGSVGAGPQRQRAITYAWDGTQFVMRSDIPTAPTFRFQAAEDATTALNTGDLQLAEALYRRALNDATLNGLGSPYDEVLTAQALFGIVVTTAAQSGIEAANTDYTVLQNAPLIPGYSLDS